MREEPEWDLGRLVAKISPVDLVLVEGKRDKIPKMEIYRNADGKPLHLDDPHIFAVACDGPQLVAKIPQVDLNDVDAIAKLLLEHAVQLL